MGELTEGFQAGFAAVTYGDRMRRQDEDQRLQREDQAINRAMAATQMAMRLDSDYAAANLQMAELGPNKDYLLKSLPDLQNNAIRLNAVLSPASTDEFRQLAMSASNAVYAAQGQLGTYQEQENALRARMQELSGARSALLPIIARGAGVQMPAQRGAQAALGQPQQQKPAAGQPQTQGAPHAVPGAVPQGGDGGAGSPLPKGAQPQQTPQGPAPAAGGQPAAPAVDAGADAEIEAQLEAHPQLKAGGPEVDGAGRRLVYADPMAAKNALGVLNSAGIDPAKLGFQITDAKSVRMEQGVKTKAAAPGITRSATSRSMPIQLVTDEAGNSKFTSGMTPDGQMLPVSFEQQTDEMEEGEDGVSRPVFKAADPGSVAEYLGSLSKQVTPGSPLVDAVNNDIGPALQTYLQGLEQSGQLKRKFGDVFTWNFSDAKQSQSLKRLSDNLERLRESMGGAVAIPSVIQPDPVEAIESFFESDALDVSGGVLGVNQNEIRKSINSGKSAGQELINHLKQYVDPKTGKLDANWSEIIDRKLKMAASRRQQPFSASFESTEQGIRSLLSGRYVNVPRRK